MDKIINWNLISHPLNWAIIILMVLIGGMVVNFAMHYQLTPNNPAKEST